MMTPAAYIAAAPAARHSILSRFHQVITATDPTVNPEVIPMMGKEMILYLERGYMKYGLSSVKNYISLHCMPIYMNAPLQAKYRPLLPNAKFQKGCINFNDASEFPVAVLTGLIADCARISIADLIEARRRKA